MAELAPPLGDESKGIQMDTFNQDQDEHHQEHEHHEDDTVQREEGVDSAIDEQDDVNGEFYLTRSRATLNTLQGRQL